MPENILYYNARIVTLDPDASRASALAVSDGRVLLAGDDDECRAAVGAGAREVDLGGAWALPGFCDSHIHFTAYARSPRDVSLESR
ncbi:MAG: hypothetical protein WKH64_04255 [Chloroflexia bacterium]